MFHRYLIPALVALLAGLGIQPALSLDKVRQSTHVDQLHRGLSTDQGTLTFTGQGVVVGIIDYGFDYTHPAFRTADLSGVRISRVWEQGASITEVAGGHHPEGYDYGVELSDAASILDAWGDQKNNSHGTHVACIAAGQNVAATGTDCPYYGIAPEADIVLVSYYDAMKEDYSNILDAIRYVFDYATSVGKPAVVNISMGTHVGPHDGTSLFDQQIGGLVGEGRVVVASAGNSGYNRCHISQTFTGASDESLLTLVEAQKNASGSLYKTGEIDLWGDEGMQFGIAFQTVSTSTTKAGDVAQATDTLWAGEDVEAQTCTRELAFSTSASASKAVKMSIKTEVCSLNHRPHIYVDFGDDGLGARNNYAVALQVVSRSAGSVHAWATDSQIQFGTKDNMTALGYREGDSDYSITEIGGTSPDVISVGAYCCREHSEVPIATYDWNDEVVGDVCSFSSYGPTLDGRQKPDVVAPGAYVASAFSSNDAYHTYYPSAQNLVWEGATYYYNYDAGTSMAAPCMAGIVALWLQADPTLTPSRIRQLLAETAVNDDFTLAAPAKVGAGKVDAEQGMLRLLAEASGIHQVSATQSASAIAYDLMGRRVSSASSGVLVIDHGHVSLHR